MAKTYSAASLRDQFDAASRAHFSLFLRRAVATVSPGVVFSSNWHIDAISEYLAACAKGQVNRLIINLPPRMLKSTIISVAWLCVAARAHPSERIMVGCYAQSLSLKHSTDCRVLLQAPWYQRLFPNTRLAADQNEKEKFATTLRGHRRAVSVGGAAIGEGGNILIIDEAGKMALVNHAPWLAALEQELFNFPDTAHDDQVDAISQYLNWVRTKVSADVMRAAAVIVN